MKSYTAAEVRAAEKPLLEAGVPLMARASAALAAETRTLLSERGIAVRSARVVVLAGAGNNGGDALFAAAELASEGATVVIVQTADRVHEEGLAAALDHGATVLSGAPPAAALPGTAPRAAENVPGLVTAAVDAALRSDVILDGILGTGTSANPALRGRAREIVAGIRAAAEARSSRGDPPATSAHGQGPAVVAVDLPSGIGADDGAVPDPTVLRATVTVTFGGLKKGLLLEPGASYAGRIVVADIGLGDELDRVTRGR